MVEKANEYLTGRPCRTLQARVLPKIWPPFLDIADSAQTAEHPEQDVFKAFYNGFQALHFQSMAKNTYEIQIRVDTGQKDSPVRAVAPELFDRIRTTIKQAARGNCKNYDEMRAHVKEVLAVTDIEAYGKYQGGAVCARWLLAHWQKQAENLLWRLEREQRRSEKKGITLSGPL